MKQDPSDPDLLQHQLDEYASQFRNSLFCIAKSTSDVYVHKYAYYTNVLGF